MQTIRRKAQNYNYECVHLSHNICYCMKTGKVLKITNIWSATNKQVSSIVIQSVHWLFELNLILSNDIIICDDKFYSTASKNKKLSYRRETARQMPTWRGARHSSPLSLRPLWLHLCIWSNPKPTTNLRQSTLLDESGIQGHSRSSSLVPAGIQNGVLS